VMRRCLTPSTMLAAILMLAAPPSPAGAESITTYRLSNNNPSGAASISEVVAYVVPPGAINDKTVQSPLTVLAGSSGFDPESLLVAVGNGEVPVGQENAGDPVQGLALNFGPEGFAPGGIFNFSLNLNPDISDAPNLVLLPDSPPGLAIQTVPPTSVDVGGGDGGTGSGDGGGDGGGGPVVPPGDGGNGPENQVPEPMSVVIWSVLAGLGLARARKLRRSSPLA
jgi:hypothetical protein